MMWPTITLPAGIDRSGMPLSIQLVGRHVSEDVLVRAGHEGVDECDDSRRERADAVAGNYRFDEVSGAFQNLDRFLVTPGEMMKARLG